MSDLSERDWKLFRPLRLVALERFYEQSLSEVLRIVAEHKTHAADRCVNIARYLKDREDEARAVFDVERRPAAAMQLVAIQLRDLLTDDELAPLSEPVRTWLIEEVPRIKKENAERETAPPSRRR
jgi:hypothetical protein